MGVVTSRLSVLSFFYASPCVVLSDNLRLAIVAAAVVWLTPRTRRVAVWLFENCTRPIFFAVGWLIGLTVWLAQKLIGAPPPASALVRSQENAGMQPQPPEQHREVPEGGSPARPA